MLSMSSYFASFHTGIHSDVDKVGVFNHSVRTFFFFKQKTAYEMRISDWSSDVCSSDLLVPPIGALARPAGDRGHVVEAEGQQHRLLQPLVDLPALRPLLGDPIVAGIEAGERRGDRIAHGAFRLRADAVARFPVLFDDAP